MTIRSFFVSMIVSINCASGVAQSVVPSITIGTHVLTVGMSESVVMSDLRADYNLSKMSGSLDSWMVEKKVPDGYSVVGMVGFEDHKLHGAYRNLEVEPTSAKSLFYAFANATKNLERQGFVDCKLKSAEQDVPMEDGAVATRSVSLACGPKTIVMELVVSDAPSVTSSIYVNEWIGHK
jgi:hypothetical protein